MTEAELQNWIIELARLFGWLVHAERPARTQRGWRTPIQGDPGFPDLVMAHQVHGVIFAEVKTKSGRLSLEQMAWADILCDALYVEEFQPQRTRYYLWRPSHQDEIEAVLRGEAV